MQPFVHLVVGREVAGRAHVGGVVAGLGFEEAAVEPPQRVVRHVLGEQREAFAAACLDQRCDEQPVDRAVWLVATDEVVQRLRIAARGELAETDAAMRQQVEDQAEVIELLGDDLRHGSRDGRAVDVGEEEVHRHAGGLLLAVRVIDEHLVEVPIDLGEPPGGRRGGEAEHGRRRGSGRTDPCRRHPRHP